MDLDEPAHTRDSNTQEAREARHRLDKLLQREERQLHDTEWAVEPRSNQTPARRDMYLTEMPSQPPERPQNPWEVHARPPEHREG